MTPRIVVYGAEQLVEFLKQVFVATGDYQPDLPSVIKIGDSIVMVSNAGIRDPMPAFLYVYVDDADETYRRALLAGASSIEKPSDMPYGDRRGMVEDGWGNVGSATYRGDPLTEEMKRFQGTWKQIALEKDGFTESLDEFGSEPRTTFEGDTFVVTLADGSVAIKGTFKIDPTRNPKTVDWTDTFGEDAGKTFPAIYSLEDDRLIFCAAGEGQERPTEFRTRPGQVLRINRRLNSP